MKDSFDSLKSLRVLYEISTIIQSGLELNEKFMQALMKVKEIADCHSASLFIHNESTGKLDEVATIGTRVDLIESIDFDMGKGFSAWVAKQRRTVLIPNVRNARHDGFHSFVSTPLISDEKLIGVMNLGREDSDAYNEKHIEVLEIIAGQLAHAIERSSYERALLEKNAALESARTEIEEQQKKIIEMERYQTVVQMAVSINHEINNPLTTIIGNVELLLMMYPDLDTTIRKKLTVMLNEAKRIAKIVEDFREMKKIAVGTYIDRFGEKMINIHPSSDDEESTENLS